MKGQEITAYVAAGAVVGVIIGWAATRASNPAPAAGSAVAANAPVMTGTPFSSAPAPFSAPSLDSVARMPLKAFRDKLERGEIRAIDVRDIDSYVAAHIPGAMHIPLSYIQGELPYLPRGKPIITYCT
ncbi:MAG: rhodanese-like domain-containing protein [Acidobacteriota bacterium]